MREALDDWKVLSEGQRKWRFCEIWIEVVDSQAEDIVCHQLVCD